MKAYKPIAYYHVATSNRGDMAIKKVIVDTIKKQINIPFAFFNIKYDKLTMCRIINQINTNCSILMIAGSGLYSNYSSPSGWYFNCKTELFEKIKIPIILMGIGCNNNLNKDIFGGELKPEARKSIKLINDLATISTVRDQRTFDILNSIGVTNHQLILDPANFLDYPEIKREKRVAINIAQHSPALGRFDGTQETRNKNLKYFANISNYLINKGYSIVFIAHDALEQSLIIDLQKQVPELEWLNEDNIDKMLHEYARCQFSLSVKMHSAIISFAVGIPSINIYYDQKNIEYLKMIGCEELGINIFENYYSKLKNKINYLIKNLDYYNKKIKDIKNKEQIKFNTIILNICNIIKENNNE